MGPLHLFPALRDKTFRKLTTYGQGKDSDATGPLPLSPMENLGERKRGSKWESASERLLSSLLLFEWSDRARCKGSRDQGIEEASEEVQGNKEASE